MDDDVIELEDRTDTILLSEEEQKEEEEEEGGEVKESSWKWMLPPIFLGFGILGLFILIHLFSGYTWVSWTRVDCFPTETCYCEKPRGGTVEQPANSYSNWGFLMVGLFVLFHSTSRTVNMFNETPVYRLLFGANMILIGVGSCFYHMSLTNVGRFFDWLGMLQFMGFVMIFNFVRVFKSSRLGIQDFWVFYMFLTVFSIICLLFLPQSFRTPIFALYIAGFLGTLIANEIWHFHVPQKSINKWYIAISSILFVLAYTFWNIDKYLVICWPNSILQGHAIWQLLVAISCGFIYLFFISEK